MNPSPFPWQHAALDRASRRQRRRLLAAEILATLAAGLFGAALMYALLCRHNLNPF